MTATYQTANRNTEATHTGTREQTVAWAKAELGTDDVVVREYGTGSLSVRARKGIRNWLWFAPAE